MPSAIELAPIGIDPTCVWPGGTWAPVCGHRKLYGAGPALEAMDHINSAKLCLKSVCCPVGLECVPNKEDGAKSEVDEFASADAIDGDM